MINGMARRDHRNASYEVVGKKLEHNQVSQQYSDNTTTTSNANNDETNGSTYGNHRNNVENLLWRNNEIFFYGIERHKFCTILIPLYSEIY